MYGDIFFWPGQDIQKLFPVTFALKCIPSLITPGNHMAKWGRVGYSKRTSQIRSVLHTANIIRILKPFRMQFVKNEDLSY